MDGNGKKFLNLVFYAQPSDYLFELQQPLSAKLIGSTNPDENNIKRVFFNYSDKTMVLKISTGNGWIYDMSYP